MASAPRRRAIKPESPSVPMRRTQSKPSRTTSTRRSEVPSTISMCGCAAMSSGKRGMSVSRAMLIGSSTRTRPRSALGAWNIAEMSSASTTRRRARARSCSPSGVSRTARVVRWKR
jgi:hypothetical protein